MCDKELLQRSLLKIDTAIDRILQRSETIHSVNDFVNTPEGVERLESICMLLISIGESIKQIDKVTDKKLFVLYPEIDWKGVMGMRDIIAHHYFDIDVEIVYEVIKNNLPALKKTITKIQEEKL